MATVKGPLLSLQATGTIGKTITYIKGRSSNIVKGSFLKKFNQFYFKRILPIKQSYKQGAIRCAFSNVIEAWKLLSPAEKLVYNVKAKGKSLTGYNIYLSENVNNFYSPALYTQAFMQAIGWGLLNEGFKIQCEDITTLGSHFGSNS